MGDERIGSAKLAVKHKKVSIIVPIFQSLNDALEEGVCRGVVMCWLAAQCDAAKTRDAAFLDQFRKDVAGIQGPSAKYFTQIHEDFTVDSEKTQQFFKQELQVYMKELTAADQRGEALPSLEQIKADQQKIVFGQITLHLSMCRCVGTKVEVGELDFVELFTMPRKYCKRFGFYYIGVGKHAIGMYLSPTKCLLIDANTCEWECTGLQDFEAFLADYVETIYPNWQFRTVKNLFHYDATAL